MWDHLGSNLNLYVQEQESQADEASKLRPTIGEDTGRNDSHQVKAESENVKLSKSLGPRHNRERKGLVRDEAEHPSSHSYEFDSTHVEKEIRGKVGNEIQSASTEPVVHRKRRLSEEQQNKVFSFSPHFSCTNVLWFCVLRIYEIWQDQRLSNYSFSGSLFIILEIA